jgi:hypothetical protein
MNIFQRAWDRQGRLESIRTRWDDQMDDVVELTRPDLYEDIDERGQFQGSDIVEGTAPHAARTMALGFQGNLVNQNIEWRRTRMQDKKWNGNDELNKWLQDTDEVFTSFYNRSNYYTVLPKYILTGLTVGSPVLLSEQDDKGDIVFVMPHYKENYLWRDHWGHDLGYHRRYKMTLLQAMQKFGKSKLSQVSQTALENGRHYEEAEFLQCIYSKDDPILEGVENVPNSPWVQFYFEAKKDEGTKEKPLMVDRYNSKPFSAWHYWRNDFETYARTPAWFAIYDIKGGQQVWESMYVEAEMKVRPPMWVPDTMRALFSMLPGARNYADANTFAQIPQALGQAGDYGKGLDFAERVNHAIERHFMTDLFQMLHKLALGPERKAPPTAYQIQQMIGEKAVLLGPGVQSFVNELLRPQDERLLEILSRPTFNGFGEFMPSGEIPEPPAVYLEETDGDLATEFVGPLAIAEKDFLIGRQILGALAEVAPLIEQDPDLVYKLRLPETVEYILEQKNYPQHLIVPQDEYEIIQAKLEEQRRLKDMIESGVDLSQMTKNMGGEVKEGSLLDRLVA